MWPLMGQSWCHWRNLIMVGRDTRRKTWKDAAGHLSLWERFANHTGSIWNTQAIPLLLLGKRYFSNMAEKRQTSFPQPQVFPLPSMHMDTYSLGQLSIQVQRLSLGYLSSAMVIPFVAALLLQSPGRKMLRCLHRQLCSTYCINSQKTQRRGALFQLTGKTTLTCLFLWLLS